MTTKIQSQLMHGNVSQYRERNAKNMIHLLLKDKIVGLMQGIIIPDNLIAETDNFINRNKLEHAKEQVCPRCLKAHVISKSSEFGLTKKEVKFLDKIFLGEVGHQGYYIDDGELLRVN